jgi:hypothetical protein
MGQRIDEIWDRGQLVEGGRVTFRVPYVGDGPDGCRRSAQVDRDELATLPTGPHQPGYSPATEARKAALAASAEEWLAQAGELERAAAAGVDPFEAERLVR